MRSRIHHFSWETGVSLELPVGWEEAGRAEGAATYAVVDDDGGIVAGTALRVQVLGDVDRSTDDAATRQAALDALVVGAERAGPVVDRRRLTVDDREVTTLVVRDAEGRLRHTTVAAGARVLMLVGDARSEDDVEVFHDAVASLRFVEP